MEKKIEGFVPAAHEDSAAPHFTKNKGSIYNPRPAVLVIGEGDTPPRVFTEKEVRALIADLKDQTMSMAVEQSIERIAAKHSITL